MAGETVNPLMSVQKAPDSGLQVVLHPLPILEISDFITRGYQRGFKGAIVGGLIGVQNGRQITIEHSFACHTKKHDNGDYKLDEPWFATRLDFMRQVHKAPQLDLVGWYSLVPKSGPTDQHLPIHHQILTQNESAVLLGFHIDHVLRPEPGEPLPLTIYESNLEADDGSGGAAENAAEGEDKEMKDPEAFNKTVLKFRELPYTTETGETEMIALQFIREAGAHGAAGVTGDDSEKRIVEQFDKKIAVTDGGKGKRRAVTQEGQSGKGSEEASSAGAGAAASISKDANLTKSEAEYMSALQAKYNAIKMMKSRVDLFVAYLEKLPPGFVAGTQSQEQAAAEAAGGNYTTPSNNILRQIQALVTNIELATPAHKDTLANEILQETNDVNLIALISDLVTSVSEVREAGKKFAVLESAKNHKARNYHPSVEASSYGQLGAGMGMGMGMPHLL